MIFFIPIFVYADSGKSTIVMDTNSGRILYKKNENEKLLIASTTKIMTCIVVLENFNIDDEITVGDEVSSMYGTSIYIKPGEKLTIRDLLYGMMLRSGNDAAITLANNTFGIERFIKEMNIKAKKLGMKNTSFQNVHGLDDETKNYSTAYDMALLAKYAYKNSKYRKIINTKKYYARSSYNSYVWYNRMNLISKYKNCLGGKNGYTPKAGKSLVSYAKKNELTLLIVSLNDPYIYENHINLYDEIFSKYKNYTIVDNKNFNVQDYHVNDSFYYPLSKDEVNSVSVLIKISSKHDEGKLYIKKDGENIGSIKIYKNKKKRKKLFLK